MYYYNNREYNIIDIVQLALYQTPILFEAQGTLEADKFDAVKFVLKLLSKQEEPQNDQILDELPKDFNFEKWCDENEYIKLLPNVKFSIEFDNVVQADEGGTAKAQVEDQKAKALESVNRILKEGNVNTTGLSNINDFLVKQAGELRNLLSNDETLANRAIVTIYNPDKDAELINYIKLLLCENEDQN